MPDPATSSKSMHPADMHADNTIHGIVRAEKVNHTKDKIKDDETIKQSGKYISTPDRYTSSESDVMEYKKKKAEMKKSGYTPIDK